MKVWWVGFCVGVLLQVGCTPVLTEPVRENKAEPVSEQLREKSELVSDRQEKTVQEEPTRDGSDASIPEPRPELVQESTPEPRPELSPELPPEPTPDAQASSRCSNEVFTWDGVKRLYILCRPDPLPASDMPVVFGFHGGFGSAQKWLQTMPIHKVGAKEGFVMVYMQGCKQGANDCSVPGSYYWNIGKKGSLSKVDDQGFVKEVLRRLSTVHKLKIDTKRVFATGHSMGGIFSYSLWCNQPTLLKAIGPLSGPPTDSTCKVHGNTSIYHVHGNTDPNVPFSSGCCSRAQKTKGSPSYLATCDSLPQCFNPSNWWPPVRSGKHPFVTLVGLDEMASKGLGCELDKLRETVNKGRLRCFAYRNCKNGKEVEVCLLLRVGHSLSDMNAVFDIPNWLWSKFKAAK